MYCQYLGMGHNSDPMQREVDNKKITFKPITLAMILLYAYNIHGISCSMDIKNTNINDINVAEYL